MDRHILLFWILDSLCTRQSFFFLRKRVLDNLYNTISPNYLIRQTIICCLVLLYGLTIFYLPFTIYHIKIVAQNIVTVYLNFHATKRSQLSTLYPFVPYTVLLNAQPWKGVLCHYNYFTSHIYVNSFRSIFLFLRKKKCTLLLINSWIIQTYILLQGHKLQPKPKRIGV